MDDAMKLIIDIWNSLSPEGRKLWIGEGQVLPTLKNGRYAAKKKPQIIKRKFDAKWNADTNQILAIINKSIINKISQADMSRQLLICKTSHKTYF